MTHPVLRAALVPLAPLAACVLLSWACSSEPARDLGAEGGGPVTPVADAGSDDDASARPAFDPTDEAITCETEPCAVEIVAGDRHFCTRMTNGTVRCWGGSSDAGVAAVPSIADAKQLSAAAATTCALVAGGGVDCWGRNDKGQLGLGDDKPASDGDEHPTPSRVTLPTAARRIDVGPSSACAVLEAGEVFCWGDNSRKQLARPTPASIGRPAKAELGDLAVARTAAGSYTGFALTAEGALVSWGAVAGAEGSVSGRIASLSPDVHPYPIELGPVSSFSVSATTVLPAALPDPARGIGHACAVVGGEVFCWGHSLEGAIGDGLPGLVAKPVRAPIASPTAWARQVVAAGEVTCARLTDGTVECTGDNARGALGRETSMQLSLAFQPVKNLEEDAMRLAASSGTICAIVRGGRVVCWGSNEAGELGQGTSDLEPHATPVPVHF